MRVKSTRGGRKRTKAPKRIDLEKVLRATERRLEHAQQDVVLAQEDVARLMAECETLRAKLQPTTGTPEPTIPPEPEPT
jgi:hypothetical protein